MSSDTETTNFEPIDELIGAVRALAGSALADGRLLPAAHAILGDWLQPGFLPPWAVLALAQLARAGAWGEINDRFYKNLAFGTGGMRGLTIGRVAAPVETGTPSALGTPEHPAVGANNLNDFTLARATAGLFRHVAKWLAREGRRHRPRLVIAHDVRHFSRHFCELAASVWTRLGGEAFIFDGPRSTPQLSFTVRHLRADAGVVITASHNPPPYNGFKCYLSDGGQVVPPHDAGVIAEVNAVRLDELPPLLGKDTGGVLRVPKSVERAYLDRLGESVLDPACIAGAAPVVLYTNLHGTGDVMVLPALKKFGAKVTTVAAQRAHDPRFPTVQSPNPENAEAFTLALAKARRAKPDIVIGTDPDDDRLGAYARNRDGTYLRLTGNRIGAALAAFRLRRMKELGILSEAGSPNATLLKTFVTTPLQDAIAAAEGVRCVNTLTGFKWLAAKLGKYQKEAERALPLLTPVAAGDGIPGLSTGSAKIEPIAPIAGIAPIAPAGVPTTEYDALPWRDRAELSLRASTLFVFGGEESYGYLGTDAVRDKDGNAAALMLVELAAWLKRRRQTFAEFLDQLYARHGYHSETLLNVVMPGADGARAIRRILDRLRENPPREVAGAAVTAFTDFGREDVRDADGDLVPKEDFYFFTLADGRRFAVRGSGTEPKIKFYLFACEPLAGLKNFRMDIRRARWRASRALAGLRRWLRAECARLAVE
ncbi:MAG: phospho-sugar mutase [Puniceicoccales bacterium]|jgi:phosphoglucomutase|nr:phospho-sugar mutase [Puniceicoccales bacterium]